MISKFLKLKCVQVLFDFYVKIRMITNEFIDDAEGRVTLNRIKNRGNNCRLNGPVTIYSIDNLTLGNGVRIGSGSFLHAMGNITIGDNTHISRNVTIYSGNHDVNGLAIPYDDKYILKPVNIGQSVWIGMNVSVTPGVTIGNGAIIGMNTVISEDVPDGACVVGAKQRIVSYRDMEEFNKKKYNKLYFSDLWPDK